MTGSKIKKHIRNILHVDETPHDLARSFAAGVFVAFTPFLGIHWIIILTLAWIFRLNKVVALTGTFVNNPWTIAFVYIIPTWLTVSAMRALGADIHPMNYELISTHFLNHTAQHTVWEMAYWKDFAREFRPYLFAFAFGTIAAGAVVSVISYFFAYFGIKYYRRGKEKLKQEKMEEQEI
ncbi:MAG: DUF2062 domain-containing protein [Nitrospirota bacterium]